MPDVPEISIKAIWELRTGRPMPKPKPYISPHLPAKDVLPKQDDSSIV